MLRYFLVLVIVLSLCGAAEASATCTGYVTSLDEIHAKIDELKDVIFLNYQKSGFTLWVPFYYWACGGGKQIFYCYTLLPLGTRDANFVESVSKSCLDRISEPVYVPIRINRGSIARS